MAKLSSSTVYGDLKVTNKIHALEVHIDSVRKDENWDEAYSWGNHDGLYVLSDGDTMTGELVIDNSTYETHLELKRNALRAKITPSTGDWSGVSNELRFIGTANINGYAFDKRISTAEGYYINGARKDNDWDTAYSERGSQIDGTGLTWNSGTGNLDVDYSEISTANITNTTSSAVGLISGRRMSYALDERFKDIHVYDATSGENDTGTDHIMLLCPADSAQNVLGTLWIQRTTAHYGLTKVDVLYGTGSSSSNRNAQLQVTQSGHNMGEFTIEIFDVNGTNYIGLRRQGARYFITDAWFVAYSSYTDANFCQWYATPGSTTEVPLTGNIDVGNSVYISGIRKDENWDTAYTHSQATGNQHSTNHSQLGGIGANDHHSSFTSTDHTNIGNSSPHHVPVSISGNGISLSGQQVSLSIGTGSTQVAAGNHGHAQLHDRAHAITSTSDHTASGLSVGHVLMATDTTSFGWNQLNHSNLGAVGANDHHSSFTSTDHTNIGNSAPHHEAASVSGNGISITGQQISLSIGTGSTQVAAGNHGHAQLHNRSHAIDGSSDHASMTAGRIIGRITTNGTPQQLTATEVRGLLNVADGANNYSLENHSHSSHTDINQALLTTSNVTFNTVTTNEQLNIETGGSPYLRFDTGGTTTAGDYRIYGWGSSRVVCLESMGDVAVTLDYNNNATDKAFKVLHNGEGSAGSELFMVQDDGNTGIGTAAPNYKLDVSGTGRFTGNLTVGGDIESNKLILDNNNVIGESITFDGETSTGLRASNQNGYVSITPLNTGWAHIYTDRSRFIFNKEVQVLGGVINAYNNTDLRLGTSSNTERVRIKSDSGNVGIGTTSPNYELDVNGDINATNIRIGGTLKNSNWDSAYTHVSSNGTDHTYIDQDLRTSAEVEFAGLKIGDNFIKSKYINPSSGDDVLILLCRAGQGNNEVIGSIYGQRSSGAYGGRDLNIVYSSASSNSNYSAYLDYAAGTYGSEQWSLVSCTYNGNDYIATRYQGTQYWDTYLFFNGYIKTDGPESELFTSIATSEATGVSEITYNSRKLIKSRLDVEGYVYAPRYYIGTTRKDDDWDSAYTHSQATGNQHSTTHAQLSSIGANDHHASFTSTDHSNIGNNSPHHAPATVSGNGISITGQQVSLSIGTGSTQVAAGNHGHTQLHNRAHAIDGSSDHSSMTANRIVGRITSNGTPQQLTAANVRTIINVADGANNYSHPSDGGGSRANLSGATVINGITVNTAGHVTGTTTRNMTAGNINALSNSDTSEQTVSGGEYRVQSTSSNKKFTMEFNEAEESLDFIFHAS